MFQQSGGRAQRPKGSRVKRALQFGLLLAICIWLFYKLQQHYNEKEKSYGDSAERRNTEEFQTIDFGRKGKAGTNAGIVEVFRDMNGPSGVEDIGEREEVGVDGDDDLDKNVVVHEVNEDLMESVLNGEGKNEEEMETQEGDSQRSGDPIDVKDGNVEFSDTNEKYNAEENVMNHDEEVDEKESTKDENEAMGNDIGEKESEKGMHRREEDFERTEIDNIQSQPTNRDERMDLNRQDGSINMVDNMQMQPSQRETANSADASETEEGVDSFQDVNGIPLDGLQLVKSSPNASSDQETISSSDNETSHGEDTTLYEDIDKSSQLDGGVDDEVQFSKKGTGSENNEGSDPMQELISLSRTTEHANEPSNTNIVDA